MQYYIAKSGAIEGPHTLETLQSMLRGGELKPSDLGAVPGAADWKPLSELLDGFIGGEKSESSPPPLPPEPPKPSWDVPFMIDGKVPSGTHGKSVRQIIDETSSGGRFVIYPYVVSVILLSFRRSSPITYIPPGRSGFGAAFGWSLLSMTFGWWGFPWGIIFTIGSLWRNAAGGVDVTEPVLTTWMGPQQADALVRNRPDRPSGGLWMLRGLIVSPLVIAFLMVIQIFLAASDSDKEEQKHPGYAEFKKADQFINNRESSGSGGNTAGSGAAAVQCRDMLQAMRDSAISEEDSIKSKKRDKRITVWCQSEGNRCLFLIKVPDLRHFTDEAKDYICDSAWFASQIGSKQLGLPENAELAVAVRGGILYDRMIVGRQIVDLDAESDDLESKLKTAIHTTDRRLTRKDTLAGYFVPASR